MWRKTTLINADTDGLSATSLSTNDSSTDGASVFDPGANGASVIMDGKVDIVATDKLINAKSEIYYTKVRTEF